MTKEEMLSSIYDEMADKTLSDGCKYITDIYKCTIRYSDVVQPDNMLYSKENDDFYRIDTIIWHPVRIGDVLDWFDKNNPEHLWWWNWVINGEIIVREWNNLRLPIDEQSDECIDYVYSLIK